MKIKNQLFITHIADFLKGDYDGCFALYQNPPFPDEWYECGEIELNIEIADDLPRLIRKTTRDLEKEIEREREIFTQRLETLERRKQEFLAIAGPIMGGEAE